MERGNVYVRGKHHEHGTLLRSFFEIVDKIWHILVVIIVATCTWWWRPTTPLVSLRKLLQVGKIVRTQLVNDARKEILQFCESEKKNVLAQFNLDHQSTRIDQLWSRGWSDSLLDSACPLTTYVLAAIDAWTARRFGASISTGCSRGARLWLRTGLIVFTMVRLRLTCASTGVTVMDRTVLPHPLGC